MHAAGSAVGLSSQESPSDGQPGVSRVHDPKRYQILGEHGRGGLGRVSRAHDLNLDRDVAIKELISRSDVSEARFLREALITARLEHPGIVPVHEAGQWPDGTPFYAMKLVAGRPLRALIAERASVDERLGLLHHVIAVADALAYAHGRNIIHRDLKPANVIVGDFGETVVIDWGLAKDLSAAEARLGPGSSFPQMRGDDLTSAGSVLGTPAYMAPEQERGEQVDQRADVFAIGAMLWELCSLHRVPPTDRRQRRNILRRAGIDPDLSTIIDKAIDPDPERRYADAGSLAADLKAFKSGARITARRYSLLAVLAHWTRRHRSLALAALAVVALAATGGIMYVRNITVERDRADAMRGRADAALVVAQEDRDRALLSEASLLLDKDPTAAKALLESLKLRSPQHALLLSRASRGAATHVVHLPDHLFSVLFGSSGETLGVVTAGGGLESIDLDTGRGQVVDHGLSGPSIPDRNRWFYARHPIGTANVTVVGTNPATTIDAGSLLVDDSARLFVAAAHLYALDNQDLYTLDGSTPTLVKRGVRNITGSDRLLLVCTASNELEVIRDGVLDRRTRCARNTSWSPMAAAGTSYAALLDPDDLLLVRDGKPREFAVHIPGEYELSMSETGLLAVADFTDKTWFVRPGGTQLELGPAYSLPPTALMTNGRFAAWGYADGMVIALDTETMETWRLKGHNTTVTAVRIDPAHARLVSVAGTEVRVWPLKPSPLTEISRVPCTVYRVVSSPDQQRAAFDCYDGGLRVWSPATGSVALLHSHSSASYGVAWWRDLPCSAGYDGRVMCSFPDGTTQTIVSRTDRIRWLTASPDHQKLAVAFADGSLMLFDGNPKLLYTHTAPLYRVSFSPDGKQLATGADDGAVVVYDLVQQRVISSVSAHSKRVVSVEWRDHDLWTASSDGTMKHWRSRDNALMLLDTTHEAGGFRFLRVLTDGWIARIDEGIVVVKRASQPATLRFEFDRRVEHVEVSADERYLAVEISGEVIIVDLTQRAIASMSVTSDGVGYAGVAIPELLVVSTVKGLFSASLKKLEYARF